MRRENGKGRKKDIKEEKTKRIALWEEGGNEETR
jgi:hypothetical protein